MSDATAQLVCILLHDDEVNQRSITVAVFLVRSKLHKARDGITKIKEQRQNFEELNLLTDGVGVIIRDMPLAMLCCSSPSSSVRHELSRARRAVLLLQTKWSHSNNAGELSRW